MPVSNKQNRPIILDLIKKYKPYSILDLGIGKGDYGKAVIEMCLCKKIDGVEIWDWRNPQWKFYQYVFYAKIQEFDFSNRTYDLYLFIDVLEHLEKEEALEVLRKVPKTMIICIPVNYPQEIEGLPYETHKSEWTLEDFKEFNFTDYSINRKKFIIGVIEK